jgi:hypothetical protein
VSEPFRYQDRIGSARRAARAFISSRLLHIGIAGATLYLVFIRFREQIPCWIFLAFGLLVFGLFDACIRAFEAYRDRRPHG